MHGVALQRWCETTFPTCIRWHGEGIGSQPANNRANGFAKRDREFRLGRLCASRALQSFDVSTFVAVAEDRSPVWPEGMVGSISHSNRSVWAAVSRKTEILSIGIDTETTQKVGSFDIRESIANDAEWNVLASLNFDQATTLALVFSAKESFYKCWYPVTKQFFDFSQATVVEADSQQLILATDCSNPNFTTQPQRLSVRFLVRAGEVYTATWMTSGEER
ncbi:MAG: 4'-phosphopantetheinyl transferase [Rubripirellula sp.]